jgi:glycosyltransferase involved in cell wall biosynthesis
MIQKREHANVVIFKLFQILFEKRPYLMIKKFVKPFSDFVIKRTKSQREKALKSGRNYLNKCLEGIIKNITFKNSKSPKISIIVPVYNSQRTIKSAIRSIQNQNMIDIEIILINDFSKDNSSQIIEKIQEQDPRIIIMNNKKNLGILYSRSLGVLKSRGKYILNLDHDDMFFDEDVFDKIYQSSERGYYDIISFMEVQGDDYYINIKDMKDGICTNHPNNLIIRQPELSYYTLFKNEEFSLVDIQIWGKLFKTKVYKAAVNLLGKKRYSVFNAINEDMIGIFSICNIAQSYKYIRKYGLFHFTSNSTASQIISKDHYMEMEVFFCDVIFDLSIANSKKYSAIIAIRLKTMFYFSLSKDITKRYLLYVLKKIINSKFVEEKYKEKIIKEYKEFKLV